MGSRVKSAYDLTPVLPGAYASNFSNSQTIMQLNRRVTYRVQSNCQEQPDGCVYEECGRRIPRSWPETVSFIVCYIFAESIDEFNLSFTVFCHSQGCSIPHVRSS